MRSSDPTFLTNQIPNSNIYWGVVNVTQGPHAIRGDTPFGAYVYGFGQYNSYAWPAATAYKKLDIPPDSLPPLIEIKSNFKGRYDIRITELRNVENEQYDTGVSDFPTIISSKNFTKDIFKLDNNENDPPRVNGFWTGEIDKDLNIYAEIENADSTAKLSFAISDMNGNFSLDSIEYLPEQIISKEEFNFTIMEYRDTILKLKFTPLHEYDSQIESVSLQNNDFDFINVPNMINPLEEFELDLIVDEQSNQIIMDNILLETSLRNIIFPITINVLLDSNLQENITIDRNINFNMVDLYKNEQNYKFKYISKGKSKILSQELVNNSEFKIIDSSIPEIINQGENFLTKIKFIPVEKGFFVDTLKINTIRREHIFTLEGNYQPNSVSEEEIFEEFSLSPNPVNNDEIYLNYKLKNIEKIDIDIIDMKGDILNVERGINNIIYSKKINISSLGSGTYILTFTIGERMFSKKFIKE